MDETELVIGPVVEEHEVLAPVMLHKGAPVGATEPADPVIVAVKVMV